MKQTYSVIRPRPCDLPVNELTIPELEEAADRVEREASEEAAELRQRAANARAWIAAYSKGGAGAEWASRVARTARPARTKKKSR